MRSLSFGTLLIGCLAAACGSASNNSLFGGPSENGCSSTSASCGTPGTGGAENSTMIAGGAANLGGQSESGGMVGSGGEEASAGNSGVGASNGTGGEVGVGGQGGGSGNADAGTHPVTGGDQAVSCPAADYHAVLMGQYRSTLGAHDVGATVDFSVSTSGVTTGSFAGPGGAKATVAGTVDCATGMLTATIENGAYQLGLVTVQFSGTFDGDYDQTASAFSGMWSMTESGSTTNGGNGPWSTE